MNKKDVISEFKKMEPIKTIVNKNSLSDEFLDDEFLTLYSYHLKKKKCLNCQGLQFCGQEDVGYQPVLTFNEHFNLEYAGCPFFNQIKNNVDENNNLIVVGTSLDNIDPTGNELKNNSYRNNLLLKLNEIYSDYFNNKNPKGLFLSGPYGCGKSYIMGLFAKKFAAKGQQVIFVYFPDLVRTIKAEITQGIEGYVEDLKNCDVLILDDFGGESMSPYIRDEVLGAVLQDRMENKKLTFITTNLDKDNLHEHLAESHQNIDDLKATRVEQRIYTLMEVFDFKDINYRK